MVVVSTNTNPPLLIHIVDLNLEGNSTNNEVLVSADEVLDSADEVLVSADEGLVSGVCLSAVAVVVGCNVEEPGNSTR